MIKKIFFFSVILSALLLACKKDIIEEDISKKEITILAPADKASFASNIATFWWELLDGAIAYDFQIVKPSFQNVISIVVDTVIKGDKFVHPLDVGKYQWRIRGKNGAFESPWQTREIQIDTTSDLSKMQPVLASPQSAYITNKSAVTFSWFPLSLATEYQFQVNEGAFTNTIVTTNVITVNFNITDNSNTALTWRVKATNDHGSTPFSSVRTFTIDRVAPEPSIPVTPTSSPYFAPTLQADDTLKWVRPASAQIILDTRYDSLFVASDSLFTNTSLVSSKRYYRNYAIISELGPSVLPSTSLTPYYYWRLNSTDSAGNVSAKNSGYFKFKLTP